MIGLTIEGADKEDRTEILSADYADPAAIALRRLAYADYFGSEGAAFVPSQSESEICAICVICG